VNTRRAEVQVQCFRFYSLKYDTRFLKIYRLIFYTCMFSLDQGRSNKERVPLRTLCPRPLAMPKSVWGMRFFGFYEGTANGRSCVKLRHAKITIIFSSIQFPLTLSHLHPECVLLVLLKLVNQCAKWFRNLISNWDNNTARAMVELRIFLTSFYSS